METKNFVPVLDEKLLQEKANEFAMKGAMKALEDFYTSYDSPYKKAITANLMNKGVDSSLDIPDIIGILNESISQQIDLIANNAVAKTFVPMVNEFLTRADAEIKFTDLLKEFISYTRYEHDDEKYYDDYRIEIIKDDGTFMYLTITDGEVEFELHFYLKSKKDQSPKVYEIYTLPYKKEKADKYSSTRYATEKTMKLSTENGTTLELPFTTKILEDGFMSYIAKMIIANTKITFDISDFNEDMFPQRCHC